MLEYGPLAAVAPSGVAQAASRSASVKDRVLALLPAARRHKVFILGSVAICALLGVGLGKILTPKYVATAEIYIDPGSTPGVGKDVLAPGQDSSGFINYVETQRLIISSTAVLERVVSDAKLDSDSDFMNESKILGLSMGGSSLINPRAAAVAILASRIQVKRPERTFIIDLSVSDRDPVKAAAIANATARGYIEVVSALQKDVSHRTAVSLGEQIEVLRGRILDAEKRVEDYKSANGLVGVRDTLVSDQQLTEVTAQLTGARANAAEARAKLDQIAEARRKGGAGVAAIASQLLSASLSALRAQQSIARQKLADLQGELGPLHPKIVDARAAVAAADAAIDAELSRFAQSQRIDYQRALELEASLSRRLESMKAQTKTDSQSEVGLRNLQRQVEEARGVYELFVSRSRETGEIQQIEPTRTQILAPASPPKTRTFPPSSSLTGLVGAALGLALGLARVLTNLPSGKSNPTAASDSPRRTTTGEPRAFAITARSDFERVHSGRTSRDFALATMGFPVIARNASTLEFDDILSGAGWKGPTDGSTGRAVVISVASRDETGLRSTLAINLALTAARRGARVALLDAAENNRDLTRVVRRAAWRARVEADMYQWSEDGVLLALPEDGEGRAEDVAGMLQSLSAPGAEAFDLIICDGPHPDDSAAIAILERVDAVVALEDETDADTNSKCWSALARMGVRVAATVQFQEVEADEDEDGEEIAARRA